MPILRKFGFLAAAGLVLAIAGPASADGLGKFEKSIKAKMPPGAMTYKSAKALGENGFSLEGVVITPPPDATGGAKAKPVQIKSITVEDLDFASIEKEAPPNFVRMRIEGLAVDQKPAEGVDLKEMFGIDKLSIDFLLDYKIDPDKKTFTLSRIEINLNGLGRMELAMTVDGIAMDAVGDMDKAMAEAQLRTASLVYDDHSLLGKVFPMAARMQGAKPEDLIAMAKGVLSGMIAGAGAPTKAIFDAIVSYMEDYKSPKGPLRVTFSPPDKASMKMIADAKGPDDVIKALGLGVNYAGTRKQEAALPPAGAPPAGAPPAKGDKAACTEGARLFVWHDDGWAAAKAAKVSKSGKGCVVRLDGGKDDVTVAGDEIIAWASDGPGKSVGKCESGAKVIVESDGVWYPAKVTDGPATSGKCPIKFANADGEKEVVELKRVRSLD